MKRFLIAAVLGLMLAPLLLRAPVGAEVALQFYSKGLTAHAAFSSANSADPCVVTEVFVFASEERARGSTSSAIAVVAIFSFNECTGTHLQTLVGSTAEPQLQGDRPLTFASLAATITVEDFATGEQVDIDVDLTWTGTGEPSRENGHFHIQRPGFNATGHFNGTTRQADAIGRITDGVTDFTAGEPSEDVLGLMEPELQWLTIGMLEVATG